jgi:hypothetical protein
MQQSISRSSLVPSGFVGESAYQDGDRAIITVRPCRGLGAYPPSSRRARLAKGERPGEFQKIKPGSITLQQALERYRDAHMRRKGRSSRTIESYRDHIERLFQDWLDRPLARLADNRR